MKTETHSAGAPPAEGDWHEAWVSALAALELDVLAAERLLNSAHTPEVVDPVTAAWTPPVMPGPLPISLRAQAEAILARQLRVAEDLARAMGSNHREQQVARKMNSGTTERTAPVFVDSHF